MTEPGDRLVPLGVLLSVVFWMLIGSFFLADGAMGFSGSIYAAVFLLVGLLLVFVGFGLLQLQNWARLSSMVLAGLGLLPRTFIVIFNFDNFRYMLASPSMLMFVALPGIFVFSIWYFHRIRMLFSKNISTHDKPLR